MDKIYHKVSLPILVPIGDYCWNPHTYAICEFFDNHEGPGCDLRLSYHLKYDKNGGVLKPEKCKSLKVL